MVDGLSQNRNGMPGLGFPAWIGNILKCKQKLRSWGWVLFGLIGGYLAAADDKLAKPENRDLKIGLALSGGGARGIAHVGVLKVLEERGIRVDAIAGTSMGALIGGLYAAGYSADELRDLLYKMDWPSILADEPPRKEMVFRRKEEDQRNTLDFELGIKNGRLLLPSGLSAGNQLKLLLRMLLMEKGGATNIQDLPLQFCAVATDIGDGKLVNLNKGDFSTALRASMALPAIFSPVLWEERLLSDGGMVRNLPVDMAREMGVDVVIAVDISKPLRSREQLTSLFAISDQAIGLFTALNVRKSLEQADIVMSPDVGDYDLLNFEPVDELIEKGVEAAERQLEALADLPRIRQKKALNAPPVDFLEKTFRLGSIAFSGLNKIDPKRVLQHLALEEDQPIDYATLRRAMQRLAGMDHFDLMDFIFQREDDLLHLLIEVREKPVGPHYLRFGLEIFSNEGGSLELGLIANHSSHPLNRRGAEWRNQVNLGRTYGLESEFFQPLDLSERFFLSAKLNLLRDTFNIFRGEQNLGEGEARSANLGLDLGYQLRNWGELRLGVSRGSLRARLRKGDPDVVNALIGDSTLFGRSLDTGGFTTSFRIDSLDDPYLPHRGFVLNVDGFFSQDAMGAEEEYEKLELRFLQFARKGANVFMGSLDFGSALGGTLPLYDNFFGGGNVDFLGLREGQISGSYKTVLRTGYFRISKGSRTRSQWGGWLDVGNYWQTSDAVDASDVLFGGSLFYGRETPIGPVYLGVGLTEGGQAQVFIAVGQLFQ